MFVSGLVADSHWMVDYASKALAVDTTLAIVTFVLGVLMMTQVMPGGAFGAIPSSFGFTLMTASVVAGAIYIIRGRYQSYSKVETLKDRNKRYQERLDVINKASADTDATKKLLAETKEKLTKEGLTPAEQGDLQRLQTDLENELGIKKEEPLQH